MLGTDSVLQIDANIMPTDRDPGLLGFPFVDDQRRKLVRNRHFTYPQSLSYKLYLFLRAAKCIPPFLPA
jgi:hypothetical protein